MPFERPGPPFGAFPGHTGGRWLRSLARQRCVIGLLVLVLAGACAPIPPGATPDQGEAGRISFWSVTLDIPQFLNGPAGAPPAEVWGELHFPRGGARRVPAVILVHGAGGVGPHEWQWARELHEIGVATLVLDSFTGRGIRTLRDRPAQFSPILAIVDAYQALALLSRHPRIDPDRIALMGFSYGGIVTLYASLSRFQRLHGPPGRAFAAHLSFYPFCNYRFVDDDQVSDRPIRIFHGTADDWTPIAPCREYADRLRRAGKDVRLIEYADAPHGFDAERLPAIRRLPDVPNPSRCFFVERGGRLVDPDTGRPRTREDACWTRGVTMGSHPAAARQARADAKDFLSATLRPDR